MNDPIPYNVLQPPVPPATYRGNKGQLLQWYEENFDPTSGFTIRTVYKGLDWVSAQLLRNYFTQYGISASLHNEHGISTLTLTDATGNYVIDKWEMGVDKEQPSIFENPLFINLIRNAQDPSGTITTLRSLLQNGDATGSAWATAIAAGGELNQAAGTSTSVPPNIPPFDHWPLGATFLANSSWMTQLQQYFDDYNRGVTNFERGVYRLRHTTNAPARWGANIADFNVEKIYTISQLLSEVQNSALWIYPLPGYLAYKILNYYIPNLTNRPNYMWGAWKSKSDANTAANNRIEISTEYLIDQINTNLYSKI